MPKLSTNLAPDSGLVDFPLTLAGLSGSNSGRVYHALRDAILARRLAPGTRLPASRVLAEQLSVRRNSVVAAFERLLADELVESKTGSGTYVAQQLPAGPMNVDPLPEFEPLRPAGVFSLGHTTVDDRLLTALRRAVSRRLGRFDQSHLAYGDPRGGEELRRRICEHLAIARGILCDPGQIILVSGIQQGLNLSLGTILKPGDAVWMEDPGYSAARMALTAVGAEIVPVPVDQHGIVVREGRKLSANAKAVYVTPSHQFPTGVTMSMERRTELLDWAVENDAWVLEDDYDSEFRYSGPTLTALAGIDVTRRVIYVGTFSKVLFPGLRMGYLVVPPSLLGEVIAARQALDRYPPSLMEGAIADLIGNGDFAIHIKRMREHYRGMRDLVAKTLGESAEGSLDVTVPDQGLHMVVRFKDKQPAGMAAEIRDVAKIDARLLSDASIIQTPDDGFVLGFSGHKEADLRSGARRLAEAAARLCIRD